MKRFFTIAMLVLMVQVSFAQEEKKEKKNTRDDINTVFSKENLKVTGGFISPQMRVGSVHEDVSLMLGGKIGMTFNDKFSLGFAGYSLANNSNFDINVGTPQQEPVRIGMGYGGLNLEYTLFTNKKIHFSIPVLIGAGGVYVYEDDDDYFNSEWDEIENSAMFVIEPGVDLEINLFKFFRVGLGATYRYVSETDLMYLEDEDLSDIMFNASFKFGFF